MNGHVYWRDKSNAMAPLPIGTRSMIVPPDMVDDIREYLNIILGGGEMVNFCVLPEPTQATGWAYYAGEVMDILQDYHSTLSPDLHWD